MSSYANPDTHMLSFFAKLTKRAKVSPELVVKIIDGLIGEERQVGRGAYLLDHTPYSLDKCIFIIGSETTLGFDNLVKAIPSSFSLPPL